MEETTAKAILRTILNAAGGWTGRSILVKDLALQLGISRQEADDLVQELVESDLVWTSIEEGMELVNENLGVSVSKQGRHFVDGFPDPHPDMWANAPKSDARESAE